MRVTGNNSHSGRQTRLSIRLRQGGQSFSLTRLTECDSPESIEIEVDTSLSAAYPSDTSLTPDEVLAAEGIESSEGFQAVVGTLPGLVVSIAALVSDRAVADVRKTASELNAEVIYVPLLLNAVRSAMSVGRHPLRLSLIATDDNLYAALADGGRLLFADSFRMVSPDDALYTVATVGKDFDLSEADIIIGGEQRKVIARKLKKYYRHIKCE